MKALRPAALLAFTALLVGCGPGGLTSAGPSGCGGGGGGSPLGGAVPSPACSSGPMDTSTPFPVSSDEAAATADRFIGSSGDSVANRSGPGASAYLVDYTTASVVVDGLSGRVVEWFERQPDLASTDTFVADWSPAPSPANSTSPEADAAFAQNAARSWVTDHKISLRAGAAVSGFRIADEDGWDVALSDIDGKGIEVIVRGNRVVGMLRDAPGLTLRLPRISRDAAILLALAESQQRYHKPHTLIGAEFQGYLNANGQQMEWIIGTGIPTNDPSQGGLIWSFGIAGRVDAGTGALTVDKASP